MSVPVSKAHTARPVSPRSSALTRRSGLWALLPALLLASCGGPSSQDVASVPESAAPQVLQSLGLGDILPLSTLAVPKPTKVLWATVNYNDPAQLAAAVRLGKALFWDQQVGEYKDASKPLMDPANPGQPLMDLNGESEYQAVTGVACASCHFSAGTDSRRDGTNFRAGSVGVLASLLVSQQQDGDELCQPSGTTLQRTGANTPSAVGAVYNRLQFWDGRAHNNFNGRNPFGDTTGQTSDFQGGEFLDNSSLASQADGPANNPVEMTCGNQNWTHLGRKMVGRKPLGTQTVAQNDSVFAGMVSAGKLNYATYSAMINEAFPGVFATDNDMVTAFGLIWGQTVQAYERTLTPTQTPMDRYLAGERTAMSVLATKGFEVFKGKGGCTNCHTGSALTDGSVDLATRLGVLKANGGTQGFHNIGVTDENANIGRQAFSNVDADKGSFKTPGLRNDGMTAPYMHDGSLKTLDEVIDFYANGGRSVLGKPTAGARNAHLDEKQKIISLGTDDRLALKEFLQNGLTDPRTFKNAGPFDHPSLSFNDGSTPLCATDTHGLKTGSGCL